MKAFSKTPDYYSDHTPPTFEQNLSQLLQLKQQTLKLYYLYSPNHLNYSQVQQIQHLKQQVKSSQIKILKFHSAIDQSQKSVQQQLQKVNKQKQDLLEMNQELVKSTEQLARKLEIVFGEKSQLENKLEQVSKQKQNINKKHKKQLENIKLMHAQEIYLLKKKNQNKKY